MNDLARLELASAGDVSDYGESLQLLPDSLERSLAVRIRLVLDRADREAQLAVFLREKLHDVAGPDVASAVNVRAGASPGASPAPDEVTKALSRILAHYAWLAVACAAEALGLVLYTNGHTWWALLPVYAGLKTAYWRGAVEKRAD